MCVKSEQETEEIKEPVLYLLAAHWIQDGGEELSDKAEKPTSLNLFIEIDVTTVGGG